MIETKDLMIGNWVYDGTRTQFPMCIVGIGTDYVYLDFEGNEGDIWESTPQELEGIPITDELLQKLGFTKDGSLWKKTERRREIKMNTEGFVYIESFDNRLCDNRGGCHDIHYLHQLQNFFRVMSKKDLTLVRPYQK